MFKYIKRIFVGTELKECPLTVFDKCKNKSLSKRNLDGCCFYSRFRGCKYNTVLVKQQQQQQQQRDMAAINIVHETTMTFYTEEKLDRIQIQELRNKLCELLIRNKIKMK